MFRKRAAPKKAVNLNDQLTEIECCKQPQQPEQAKSIEVKGRVDHLIQSNAGIERIQSACLDSMFPQQETTSSFPSTYLEELKQENLLEQKRPQMEEEQQNLSVIEQEPSAPEQSQESVQVQPQQPQPDRLIVVEEDENNLEVINDIDGPQNSEEEQFADEIIRRTLTKSNYSKLNRKPAAKQYESKERSLLAKISISSVLNDIRKAQLVEKESLTRIQNSIAHHSNQVAHHRQQLQEQQNKLENSRLRFQEVRSVLQFIYDRGDKVREFTLPGILEQIKEEQPKAPPKQDTPSRPQVVIEDDSEEYS